MPRKPENSLLVHGPDHWNNACLYPYSDNWSLYARGYKVAADRLVEHIGSRHRDQDTLVYPILFLYRQYIELRLKHLSRDAAKILDSKYSIPKTHKLDQLWNELLKLIRSIEKQFGSMGDDTPVKTAGMVIKKIVEIDGGSFAFRYPVDTSNQPSIPHDVKYINVRHYKEQIEEVSSLLEGMDVIIGQLEDMKNEYLKCIGY